jgi:hypothetical protein
MEHDAATAPGPVAAAPPATAAEPVAAAPPAAAADPVAAAPRAATADTAAGACRNCGDATPGAFCPSCGQPRASKLVSLRRIIADAVEDHLSLNATTPRTLGVLVAHPGGLTAEYLQGRIARYLPPLRLYIIASFAFFLAFGVSRATNNEAAPREGEFIVLPAAAARAEDPAAAAAAAGTEPTVLRLPPIPVLSDNLEARLAARLQLLGTTDNDELRRVVSRELLARAPIAVFLLLPLLAGVLKLLYVRHRRLYVEHFIFAVHLQAFAFVLFTALHLTGNWPILRSLLWGWLLVYIVLAFRRVYPQSWPRTLVKLALLGWVYLFSLAVTVAGIAVVTLLTAPI